MNYWLLIGSPDKWFSERSNDNAMVNSELLELNEQAWRVRKEYFSKVELGDKCIVKISQDKRSIERRTLENGNVVDLLESGIYAIGEIIQKLYYDEKDECFRVKIKISNNLFKEDKIIDAEMAEKILGNDYLSQSSKKIAEQKFLNILSIIDIEENASSDELEGDSSIEINNLEEEDTTIYPAEVKIQRDMYSVRELKTDYEEKMLVLAPDFQREFVWNLKQKSELIESILMGIPLPMIYFFEGEGGIIQVVDGKQRLTSLFEFLDDKYPLSHTLSILKDLRGKRYKDLSPAERTKIARHQFVTQTIIPPTPDKIKFDIFERVNRKGTTLNNQEMRNALYQGKSTQLLEKLANNESFQKATGNAISSTRMKDRYMILRVLSFYIWKKTPINDKGGKLVDYKSDIDEFLGKTMEYINHQNDDFLNTLTSIFDAIMNISFKLRGEDGFRIPSKERKRPINMALMESLAYLFSQVKDFDSLDFINPKIDNLFNDKEFITSITQRVDSSVSVKDRFDKMDNILTELSA